MKPMIVRLILSGLSFFFALSIQAQITPTMSSDEPLFPCPYRNAEFYQGATYPYYNPATHSLDLLDPETRLPIRTLDTFTEFVRLINWSPNCRYLTGAVGEARAVASGANFADTYGHRLTTMVSWNSRQIVIWDAVSGSRLYAMANPGNYLPLFDPVLWSPESNRAVLLGGCPQVFYNCVHERIQYDVLWNNATNNGMILGSGQVADSTSNAFQPQSSAWFNQYWWDMDRGWLWSSGIGGVSIFDQSTGQRVAFLSATPPDANCGSYEVRFRLSEDAAKAIVYSERIQPNFGDYGCGGISVYDIASSQSIFVNAEGFAAPDITFSPD
ncbi:MAG: hypothetical protein U0670_00005, partial [Anaerolineae bacterium]